MGMSVSWRPHASAPTPLLSAGHTSPPCYPRGTHHPAAIHGAHITPLLSTGHTSPPCYPRGTHHPAAIHGAHITPCYPRGTHHPAAIHEAHITPLLSTGHTSPSEGKSIRKLLEHQEARNYSCCGTCQSSFHWSLPLFFSFTLTGEIENYFVSFYLAKFKMCRLSTDVFYACL